MKTFFSLIFMGISTYLFCCLDEMTWVAYTIAILSIIMHVCIINSCYKSSNPDYRGEEDTQFVGLLIMPIILSYLYFFCDKNISSNLEGIILLSYIAIGLYVSIPNVFIGCLLAMTSIPITLTFTLLPWETFSSLFLIGISIFSGIGALVYYNQYSDAIEQLVKTCEAQEKRIKQLEGRSQDNKSFFLGKFASGLGRAAFDLVLSFL